MSTLYVRREPMERALQHFLVGDGCWPWTAGTGHGYGMLSVGDHLGSTGRTVRAHRLIYEALVGPIPSGLELDHLCRNRRCVRPSHLEPVTGRENKMRGTAENYIIHRTSVCKRGHPKEPYVACNPCAALRQRDHRARRKVN